MLLQGHLTTLFEPLEQAIERPGVDHAIRWNAGQASVRDCGLSVSQLDCRVCIAIQRDETTSRDRAWRELVIHILTRRIAVDLHGNPPIFCRLEHDVPLSDDAGS